MREASAYFCQTGARCRTFESRIAIIRSSSFCFESYSTAPDFALTAWSRTSRSGSGRFHALQTSWDSRRKAATSATLATIDQFSNVEDFFAEQAKDLNSGIGIPIQQAQEFLARNEL